MTGTESVSCSYSMTGPPRKRSPPMSRQIPRIGDRLASSPPVGSPSLRSQPLRSRSFTLLFRNGGPGVAPAWCCRATRRVDRLAESRLRRPLRAPGSLTNGLRVRPRRPGGTVTFKDGATALGPPVAVANGRATLTTAALAVGTHSLTAAYSGDATFAPATSPPLSYTVNKAATRVVAEPGVIKLAGLTVSFPNLGARRHGRSAAPRSPMRRSSSSPGTAWCAAQRRTPTESPLVAESWSA